MFDFLNQGWVGSIIGILGVIIGIAGLVLYVKSKIGPRPACQLTSLRIIGREEQELPPQIKILFDEKDVPRVTLTKAYFWNCGTETIRGNQIVEDDPIRFSFDSGDKILSAHVAAVTRPVNKCAITVPANMQHEALLTFDFLDPNDGLRLEVLHTSKKRYPDLKGTIRGIPKGIKQLINVESQSMGRVLYRMSRRRNLIFYVALGVGLITLIGGLVPESWLLNLQQAAKERNESEQSVKALRVGFLTVGALYTLMPLAMILSNRRRYPKLLDMEYRKKSKSEPP